MKKKFLIALVFIFFLNPLSDVFSEEYKPLDGLEWRKMDASEKVEFLRGWSEGSIQFMDGILVASMDDPDSGKCWRMISRLIKNTLEEKGVEFINMTFLQVVETIDSIYSDPRVRLWKIKDVMPIVRGRLNGVWTEKDVDEVIAYYVKKNELDKKYENRYKSQEEFDKYIKEQPDKPKVLKR